jgi:hypothetical protein
MVTEAKDEGSGGAIRRLKMKWLAFALLLVATSVAAQDLRVPKTINPDRPAQAAQPPAQAAQRRCLAQAGRPEKYLLDRNLSIEAYRYFNPQPENNCSDTVGHVDPPEITSEQQKDPEGHPYIAQAWRFYVDRDGVGRIPTGKEFSLVRFIDPKATPSVDWPLNDMSRVIPLIVGTRIPSGDYDDQYKDPGTYTTWQLESDRRFDDRVNWLHAREIVFVRKPPLNDPNPTHGPIYIRIRKIVDTCNQQVYVLRDTEGDDDWFNTFQVHCDK